jgi:alkanesulfonate monooxygenase SsuD/methylene tetrahydromethanopterin reductase-like flavin-dependent oxidoreductase (luciferase family)
MYGYPYPSGAVRLQQLGEAVQLIRRMWTDAPASFSGRHYTLEGAFCNPRPDPVPPILIGARGEQLALRVVARHGDWWECHGVSAQELRRKSGVLAEHCAAVGRDPTSILYAWQCQSVALGDSQQEARTLAERSPLYHHTASDARLVGTPEQLLERLEEYVDIGVRHFILRFLDFPRSDGAIRFAAQVAGKLRAPAPIGGAR